MVIQMGESRLHWWGDSVGCGGLGHDHSNACVGHLFGRI